MKSILLLEDGTVFEGTSRGASCEVFGEVVFNTSMIGYQETLTDSTYKGQIVAMTFPMIGNYGINSEDKESDACQVKGFVVREICDFPNNFRCEKTIDEYLCENNVCAIEGIDTRALTRILRDKGTMNGAILPADADISKKLEEIKAYQIEKPVYEVTSKEKKTLASKNPVCNVAVWDFGCKNSLLANLVNSGCNVTVFSATTPAEEILNGGFDGVMLSNGPGNPKAYEEITAEVKKVVTSGIPVLGVGLGHQLAALSMGADTEKLQYGHRGASQPVKEIKKDRTYITVQNHGYAVKADSVSPDVGVVSHININDNTVEGIEYKNYPVTTVQFYPDTEVEDNLFDRFVKVMTELKGEVK